MKQIKKGEECDCEMCGFSLEIGDWYVGSDTDRKVCQTCYQDLIYDDPRTTEEKNSIPYRYTQSI